jgi:hypothetical protein
MGSVTAALILMLAGTAAAGAGAGSAGAPTLGPQSYPKCLNAADSAHAFVKPNASVVHDVTIPDVTDPAHSHVFHGHLYLPKNRVKFPGKRPMVAVMHGINGNPCAIRWIARYLAGNGFVAIDVYRHPTDADPSTPAIDKPDMSDLAVAHSETKLHRAALLSAVRYLRSPASGHPKIINRRNLSLVGHSLGAVAVTLLQGQIPHVRASVQIDNLKRFAIGDLGSAFNCTPPRQLQVVAKAPSLGFANGGSCLDFDPTSAAAHNKSQKLPGFRWWKGHKKPAMELVMDGFVHDDFTGDGTDQQLRMVGYYTLNWLAYFARQKQAAGQRLLDDTPLGQPLSGVLSHTFDSALYAPGLKVCNTPLLNCL